MLKARLRTLSETMGTRPLDVVKENERRAEEGRKRRKSATMKKSVARNSCDQRKKSGIVVVFNTHLLAITIASAANR